MRALRPAPITGLLVVSGAFLVASCGSPVNAPPASLPEITTTTPPSTTTTTTTPAPAPSTTSTPPVEPAFHVIAWLEPDAPGLTLQQAVAGWPGVGEALYVDSQGAFEEFAALFPSDPELLVGVDPTSLPPSLRIRLEHASFTGAVAGRLRELDAVASVVTSATSACSAFPEWDIVVFAVGDRGLTKIRNRMLATDGIDDVTIWTAEQGYEEFAARFAEDPSLLTDIQPADLGISLRAVTTDPGGLTSLALSLEEDASVRSVHVGAASPACD